MHLKNLLPLFLILATGTLEAKNRPPLVRNETLYIGIMEFSLDHRIPILAPEFEEQNKMYVDAEAARRADDAILNLSGAGNRRFYYSQILRQETSAPVITHRPFTNFATSSTLSRVLVVRDGDSPIAPHKVRHWYLTVRLDDDVIWSGELQKRQVVSLKPDRRRRLQLNDGNLQNHILRKLTEANYTVPRLNMLLVPIDMLGEGMALFTIQLDAKESAVFLRIPTPRPIPECVSRLE